jgi:hypothetical protein
MSQVYCITSDVESGRPVARMKRSQRFQLERDDALAEISAKASVALSVAGPFSTLSDGFWLFALAADLLVQPNCRRSFRAAHGD